jgi:hypothetical protein
MVSSLAVTTVLPSPIAVRSPDRLTIAIVASEDDHWTTDVRSSTCPSDIVARAVSCDVSPLTLRLALPSIESATTVAVGVGATVELPHALPRMNRATAATLAEKELSRILTAESRKKHASLDY